MSFRSVRCRYQQRKNEGDLNTEVDRNLPQSLVPPTSLFIHCLIVLTSNVSHSLRRREGSAGKYLTTKIQLVQFGVTIILPALIFPVNVHLNFPAGTLHMLRWRSIAKTAGNISKRGSLRARIDTLRRSYRAQARLMNDRDFECLAWFRSLRRRPVFGRDRC